LLNEIEVLKLGKAEEGTSEKKNKENVKIRRSGRHDERKCRSWEEIGK